MVKKKQKTKKRKPKGKRLSEALQERDEAAARDAAEDEPEPSEPFAKGEADGPLESEPPPQWDDDSGDEDEDDDVVEAKYDDEDEVVEAKYDDEELEDDDEDEERETESAAADGDDEDYDEDDDEWEDDEAAAQMGHRRYVISGFFALWCIVAYICGQALQMAWSWIASKDWAFQKVPQLAALPHEGELISRASVSLVIGGVVALIGVGRYYVRPDIRQWADEVAEELSKVKWPTRKEIGNHTVVCIAASIVLTLYLTLLDRFWGFVTNLIYSTGA